MLVISQKLGDEIKLGSDITIRVFDIKAGQVRLGIEAPREVSIQRQTNQAFNLQNSSDQKGLNKPELDSSEKQLKKVLDFKDLKSDTMSRLIFSGQMTERLKVLPC